VAKLSISRLLEASKLLQTKAGQELQELITFVNDLANQIVLALRQGLTFEDNFKCKVVSVTLTHNTVQTINSDSKQIFSVMPARVVSTTTAVTSFIWYINSAEELTVNAQFLGAPTDPQTVKLIIFFV